MRDSTLRSQLHTAVNLAEIARADLFAAEQRYQQARDRVNEIIDKLAPLTAPDGGQKPVDTERLRTILSNRKIALIKLVREATIQHARDTDRPDSPFAPGPMSLKAAKDLVEDWILDQRSI